MIAIDLNRKRICIRHTAVTQDARGLFLDMLTLWQRSPWLPGGAPPAAFDYRHDEIVWLDDWTLEQIG